MSHLFQRSAATALLGIVLAGPAAATTGSVVHVTLSGAGKSEMHMSLDRDHVPSGEVTFEVRNVSPDLDHEMVVVKTDGNGERLPYDDHSATVEEDRVATLGEVEELKPHANGALTVRLPSGHYILLCNIPGHFASGMHVAFQVD